MREKMNGNDTHKYDDIMNLPHHVSNRHPQMSPLDRAAQFAPFAALTGYDAAIEETARLTQERIELDESSKEMLDARLKMIKEHLAERPEITFTCFQPDERKQGGTYLNIVGKVKKVDEYEHRIVLEDGTTLAMENLFAIKGDIIEEKE